MSDSPPQTLPSRPSRRAVKAAEISAVAALVFRIWYASFRPLVPDEAYYWVWSRHLAGGYFDHPPFIAWLIRASTTAFGVSELGVRALGLCLMAATVAVVIRIGREIGLDARARLLLLAIWLASPLMAGLATVMTPDTPSAFFATVALLVAVRITNRLERGEKVPVEWLVLGAAGGLALLSKYTAVLTAAAIAGAFLTHPRGRRALRGPGPYVATVVAGIVFLPVVRWNARHDWASFRFQLSHGLAERESNAFLGLGKFVLGQGGMWTPVLFGLGVVAVAGAWRHYRQLSLSERILVWSSSLPLVFFAYAATRTHGEENWPDLAYFPMSVLTARYVSFAWDRRVPIARVGCAVALGAMMIIQFPELIRAARVPVPVSLRNLFGWRELGAEMGRARDASNPDLIMADKMQDAGELAFYMPGRPEVWHYRRADRKMSAFLFFDGAPDPRRAERILFMGNDWDDFCAEYGFRRVSHGYWVYLHGHRTKDRSRMWSVLERAPKP